MEEQELCGKRLPLVKDMGQALKDLDEEEKSEFQALHFLEA